MKKIIVLTGLAIALHAAAIFAGEPMVSSKQVIVPPPVSYFRGNEFDIGAFATYVTWSCGPGEAAAHGRGADVLTSPPGARP